VTPVRLLAFERRWMATLFDAIIPAGAHEGLALGARDVPHANLVGELCRYAPGQFLLGLRAAVWLAYLSPLLSALRTFGGLDPARRVRHLERLADSRLYVLREVPMLLKMVACLAYGALPEVQSRIGLPPASEGPPDWMRS
jgi:hypothetical protein